MNETESQGGRTAVIIGGGALLVWLLLRGRGWLIARGQLGDGKATIAPAGSPCRVRLDATGIELDGARADLTKMVARCRAAGVAEVTATGAAIVGEIGEVLRALREAGVTVLASPDLWDVAGFATSRTRSS
jgi:hypothetical protein